MQMVPNPAPVQPAVNRFAGRLISRGLLADKYGYAFGAFGLVCTSNSFYTTSVGVHQIWGIMFGESDVGYVIGAIVAVALFLGQIFNSDWDQEVQPIDPDTEEPMEDENGDPVFVLEEVPNRKRNYILWLLPDAMFTAVFWMPRFARLLSHLLLNRPVEWTTVRDVWFAIPWHAIADGMPVPTWGMFFTFFFFVALPALALAAAWGVASAYFPEKALLGPRTRERMKAAMKAQFAQIQGALGA